MRWSTKWAPTSFLLQVQEELPVSSRGTHPTLPPGERREKETGQDAGETTEEVILKSGRWVMVVQRGRERVILKKLSKNRADKHVKEGGRRLSLEAAVDLWGPEDPGFQGRAIPNHVDNPPYLTLLFFFRRASLLCAERVWVSADSAALSVAVC